MASRQSFLHLSGRIHLSLTFCPPDNRRRDLDNLLAACKPGIDGLAMALGIDDARFEYTLRWGDKTEGGAVNVAIGVMGQFVEFRGQIS